MIKRAVVVPSPQPPRQVRAGSQHPAVSAKSSSHWSRRSLAKKGPCARSLFFWRFSMAALWVFAAAVFVTAPARADVGGQVPGPGLCDYPGVGNSGLDGVGVYHYWCAFPTEINGSHWQCIYGGAAALGSVGASFLFLNASISSEIGVLQGVCYWACPDLSVSDVPNPPGAWKNYITPTRCRTIAPAPMPLTQEPPPDDVPPPPPPLAPSNDLHATGAPTNPDIPNPDATQNPQH